MSEAIENARKTAYLVEYLVHEARTKYGAEQVRVKMPDTSSMSVTFNARSRSATASLPPKPPEKYRPAGWDAATAELAEHARGAEITWEWPPPSVMAPQDAERYIRELLTFSTTNIETEMPHGIKRTLQTQDPEQLGATDFRRAIGPSVTAILALDRDEPQLSWYDDPWRMRQWLGRPNVIYRMGVSRMSKEIADACNTIRYGGKLEAGAARQPAEAYRITVRVIIDGRSNRNRLRHPNIDGLSVELRRQIIDAGKEMVSEWMNARRADGVCFLGDEEQAGDRLARAVRAPAQPYGREVCMIASRPVNLDRSLGDHLAEAIGDGLQQATEHTVDRGGKAAHTLRVDSITVESPDGEKRSIDTRLGTIPARSDLNGIPTPIVTVAQRISVQGTMTGPEGAAEQIHFRIPVIPAQQDEVYGPIEFIIEEEARDWMTEQQVLTASQSCRTRPHGVAARALATWALDSQRQAYAVELAEHLEGARLWTPAPDEPVTLQVGKDGVAIIDPEQ